MNAIRLILTLEKRSKKNHANKCVPRTFLCRHISCGPKMPNIFTLPNLFYIAKFPWYHSLWRYILNDTIFIAHRCLSSHFLRLSKNRQKKKMGMWINDEKRPKVLQSQIEMDKKSEDEREEKSYRNNKNQWNKWQIIKINECELFGSIVPFFFDGLASVLMRYIFVWFRDCRLWYTR